MYGKNQPDYLQRVERVKRSYINSLTKNKMAEFSSKKNKWGMIIYHPHVVVSRLYGYQAKKIWLPTKGNSPEKYCIEILVIFMMMATFSQ